MVNIFIKANYKTLFGREPLSLKKAIPNKINSGSLITLSMISYSDRSDFLNEWCKKKLSLSKNGKKTIKKVKINKRPSNLILWSEFLERKIEFNDNRRFKIDNYLKSIVELLTSISEKENQEKEGYWLNNVLYGYQDAPLFQFYRTLNIFIKNESMSGYRKHFENKNSVELQFILTQFF